MIGVIFHAILLAFAWHVFKSSAFVLYVHRRTGKVTPLSLKASWLLLFLSVIGWVMNVYVMMKAFDPSL